MKTTAIAIFLFSSTLLQPLLATVLFRAELTPEAVVPDSGDLEPGGISPASGWAYFEFNEILGTLSYEIILNGLVFDETLPRQTLFGDNELVRAVHVHFGTPGENGPHGLNIYGAPREDDSDLIVEEMHISGIWDDEDENFFSGTRGPGDSIALADALPALFAGELYLQVHTIAYRQGELRGQILPVPEPQLSVLSIIGFFSFTCIRKRA